MARQTALTDALFFRTSRMTAETGPIRLPRMESHEAAVRILTAADVGMAAGTAARSPGGLLFRRLVVADGTARQMMTGIAAYGRRMDIMAELYGQVRRILHRKREHLFRIRRFHIDALRLR